MTRSPQKKSAKLRQIFRYKDLEESGIPDSHLRSMVREGQAEQVARGLYRLTDAKPTELLTVAMVSTRIPQAIVCLLTALHIHQIGTQAPHEVWIALDFKARKPKVRDLPIRVVRFSGRMRSVGVQTRQVQGIPIRITSPARTVVDCFRYRNKIGIDVALEALRDAFHSRIATLDEIERVAAACRASRVMRPYLQSLVAS